MTKIIEKSEKREEVISMFLGLGVVIVVVFLIFNFLQRRKGNVSVPGVSQDIAMEEKKVEEGKYEVRAGDSLWKIAQQVYGDGFKWTLIAKENNLNKPGFLEIGQKLAVPTLTEAQKQTVTTEIPSEYKVVKGDNLWKIAAAVYHDGYQWTKIWDLNRKSIIDPNKLEIGMTLRLR